jgi:hypothetical protein
MRVRESVRSYSEAIFSFANSPKEKFLSNAHQQHRGVQRSKLWNRTLAV